MKRWSRIAVVLALPACATVGHVKTDFDESADFGSYKTYAFTEAKQLEGSDLLSNTMVRGRIETLLKEQLAAKGLAEAAAGAAADVSVQYWAGVKEKEDVARVPASPTYYGSHYYDHWDHDRYVPYTYREGTLIVDLIDRSGERLVWRAYLVQVLNDATKDNVKHARQLLSEAFENYPPHKK